MQEFLNENLKPYNALTREEKHILLDSDIDGAAEFYNRLGIWELKRHDWFDYDTIYRTKPKEYKKLDIPWQHIDEKWNYAAMDNDGEVFIYSVLPIWRNYYWSDVSSDCIISVFKLDTTGIVAEHSLTERPEGV